MKTTIKTIMMLLALLPMLAFAQYQSPSQKVYEKYAGKDGFTSVSINKELFQMIMKMEVQGEGTEDLKEMQQMMDQLDGLKVLTFSDSTNPGQIRTLYQEFSALFPSTSYKELMAIRDNGDNIRFLIKETGDGKIQELVMLAEEPDEVTLLSLVGRIDMSTVSKISSSMKIQGMENLQKMKDHKEMKH